MVFEMMGTIKFELNWPRTSFCILGLLGNFCFCQICMGRLALVLVDSSGIFYFSNVPLD